MCRILFAAKHSWTALRMSRLVFVGSYLQVTWWALGQWKERIIRLNGLIFIELHTLLPDRYRTRDASQVNCSRPYAPLRYSLWLACVAGAKRGGGGEREKRANGKRERSPSLPSLPNPPSPFSPSFQSPATFDACYPGYTLAYSAFGSLYQLLFVRSDTPTPFSFPTISSDPALWKS